jgi:hypothetical protein
MATNATKKPAEKVEEIKEKKTTTSAISLEQQLSETNARLENALKAIEQLTQNQSPPVQTILTAEPALKGKKIKVINLMGYQVNVCTEPFGNGKIFVFDDYGSIVKIKFDDLEECYSSYRKTFEDGSLYIADADAVAELGLAEDYQKLYDKKTVDKIILLKTDIEVDMFLNMSQDLRESTARAIAERMVSGEKYDLNLTHRIQQESDIDFEKMVSDIKSFNQIAE